MKTKNALMLSVCILSLISLFGFKLSNHKTSKVVVSSGFNGVVIGLDNDGALTGALLTFTNVQNWEQTATAVSDANGNYHVDLAPGNYFLTTKKAGFSDYKSNPGWGVVSKGQYGTWNVFMEPIPSN